MTDSAIFRLQVFACLRRLGFRREMESKSGSAYYRHDQAGVSVRVSDHEVPMTDEREHNGGGWRTGWNVLIGDEFEKVDAARELVHIRRDVRRQLRLQTH